MKKEKIEIIPNQNCATIVVGKNIVAQFDSWAKAEKFVILANEESSWLNPKFCLKLLPKIQTK